MVDALWDISRLLGAAIFVVILVYVATRAASFAHFRTKLEYWRKIRQEELKEPKGDDRG